MGRATLELVASISRLRAEKTRFGSTAGVDASSARLSMCMGSLKAEKVGICRDFLLVDVEADLSTRLPMLSFDSCITVKRFIARCVSVSPEAEVFQLVTLEVVGCETLASM
jgi:hypothetical protein